MTGAVKNGLLSLSFDELTDGVGLILVGTMRDTRFGLDWREEEGYGLVETVWGVRRRRKVTAKEWVSSRPTGDSG
jgi:hypothetical protein